MTDAMPFRQLPDPPASTTGASVLVRIAETLGFRFYWATDALSASDIDFRPSEDTMSLREIAEHILMLTGMVAGCFDADTGSAAKPETFPGLRRTILQEIDAIRSRLLQLSDEEIHSATLSLPNGKEFPVWNAIHGPLCDALTHVGQINSWRRIAGNPVPKVNFFLGLPPRD